MTDISNKKFYYGDDIARKIDIAESTVRKYALIIEKSGWSFAKSENNARAFTDSDVEVFKMSLDLRKELGVSVEKAVDMSVRYHLGSDTLPRPVSDDQTLAVAEKKPNFLQEYRLNNQILKKEIETIKENHTAGTDIILNKVNELVDENKELRNLLEESLKEQKKPFFSKLFRKG